MEKDQKMMADLVSGIMYKYLHMSDTVERDKALLRIQSNSCLSDAAKDEMSRKIETKNTETAFPEYEDYCFEGFQDFLIEEIIRNLNAASGKDFKHKVYNELIDFLENPLCPFDKPSCGYGLWEDMDDYIS